MLICQITDCHIVEPDKLLYGRVDTAAMLREAVDHINNMDPRPDVVVATGDLVNAGRPSQYEHLVSILSHIDIPVYPVPGNHDDRTGMRRCRVPRSERRLPNGRAEATSRQALPRPQRCRKHRARQPA